jgi:hypothetical protein
MRSIEVMSGMVPSRLPRINPYLGKPMGTGTLVRGGTDGRLEPARRPRISPVDLGLS